MKWGKKMKKLKPVHYHGYIYWILMILGIFAGRVFDGFSLDTLISISIIVGFTLFGDIVTQYMVHLKLNFRLSSTIDLD